MNNTCPVSADLEIYYRKEERLEKLAERQVEARKEAIKNAVDDIMGSEDSDIVIEAITEDTECEKAIFELALADCSAAESISELPLKEIQYLAAKAFAINKRIEAYVTKCVINNNPSWS